MTLALNAYCQVKATASQVVGSGNEIFTDDSDASPMAFADGTGAGQAQKLYEAKAVSIAASGNTTIDLSGAVNDVLGSLLSLTVVKGIYVEADPTNVNDVVVGAGTNPFVGPLGGTTPTFAVKPGGKAIFLSPGAGWPVVNSTGDILKIANGGAGTAVLFTIKIWGY